jgi:glycosidase
MNKASIFHRPSREFVIPTSQDKLSIRILCQKEEIESVSMVYWKRGSVNNKKTVELLSYCETDVHSDYRTELDFKETTHYIQYYFIFHGQNNEVLYFFQEGFESKEPKKGWFEYLWSNDGDIFNTPDWSKGIVYYQIFPDRFCRVSNDENQLISKWNNKPTRDNYFGGNIKGIISKLTYLDDLGIDAIYLCPIFEGEFNHKYATINYFKIDPMFGSKKDLNELVEKAHKRGIKILLDGVFNHASTKFEKFREFQNKGTDNGWFYRLSEVSNYSKVNYECVGDYAPMPKFNTSNEEVREYIYSVMEYWIEESSIDGWRLDVADEVDISTWQIIRNRLKRKYPSALLLGETWCDGIKNVGFGDQLDCIMNYQFRSAVLDLFATRDIDCKSFTNRIGKVQSFYHDEVNRSNYNLLSSHDVARFLTVCRENKSMFSLAICFQMTFIGSPAIYYGDESEMVGENDPDCRGCMDFNESSKTYHLYKDLISLRKTHKELINGEFHFLKKYTSEDTFAFERKGNATIQIFFNLGGNSFKLEQKHKMLYSYPKNVNKGMVNPFSMKIIKLEDNYES